MTDYGNYKNYIKTNEMTIISFDKKMVSVTKKNPVYDQVMDCLKERDFARLPELLDIASAIKIHSSGRFYVNQHGQVVVLHSRLETNDGPAYIKNSPGCVLPDVLSVKLLDFVKHDMDVSSLLNFLDLCQANPNQESVKDLFAFLEHNNISITEDGHFVAYKRVRDDFKDHQTASLDYSVGKEVSMPREDVCHDRTKTCAEGLHVAAYRYADTMYTNGPMIEVKVSPYDVCAVPEDYNNEKMRVCKLHVLRVASGPRHEIVYPAFKVGETVICTNDDESTMTGEVESIIPAKDGEAEPSYMVKVSVYTFISPSDVHIRNTGIGYANGIRAIITRYVQSKLQHTPAIEPEKVPSLETRVGDLEKNTATKNDVQAAKQEIIQQLEDINKKMGRIQ